MISAVTREIYVQPPITKFYMNFNMMMRYLFLTLEFLIFVMILAGNFLFLAIRMLTPNQVNLVKIEPKKQTASKDTIESISLLVSQY